MDNLQEISGLKISGIVGNSFSTRRGQRDIFASISNSVLCRHLSSKRSRNTCTRLLSEVKKASPLLVTSAKLGDAKIISLSRIIQNQNPSRIEGGESTLISIFGRAPENASQKSPCFRATAFKKSSYLVCT